MTRDPAGGGPDLLKIYRTAIPLNNAIYHFGDQTAVRRYRALMPKMNTVTVVLSMIAQVMGKQAELPPETRIDPQEVTEGNSIRHNLEQTFRRRLATGEFLALGYVVPRNLDDRPREVPADLLVWPQLSLDKATAEGQGLRIEAIRVVPRALALPPAPVVAAPQRGRPSERTLILAAYEACQSAKLIDFEQPQVRAIEAVVQWLRQNKPDDYGDGRGFGAEAVRQTIADDFRSKAHRKQ